MGRFDEKDKAYFVQKQVNNALDNIKAEIMVAAEIYFDEQLRTVIQDAPEDLVEMLKRAFSEGAHYGALKIIEKGAQSYK